MYSHAKDQHKDSGLQSKMMLKGIERTLGRPAGGKPQPLLSIKKASYRCQRMSGSVQSGKMDRYLVVNGDMKCDFGKQYDV
jgi:hypothetical protein